MQADGSAGSELPDGTKPFAVHSIQLDSLSMRLPHAEHQLTENETASGILPLGEPTVTRETSPVSLKRNTGEGRLGPFFFTGPVICSPIHSHWLPFLPISWRLTSGIITIKKMVNEE
jgi:hypothetical protein